MSFSHRRPCTGVFCPLFFFNDTAPTEIYTLSLHDALPIYDVLAGKVAFTADARCWPAGVPSFLLFPANPVRIIQSPKEVLMVWQQNAEIRRITLDQPHSKNPKPSWYGESVGHYEGGDTLVGDTIG